MPEKQLNRDSVYKFLDGLIDNHPGDAIGLLKDIIVCNCLFPDGDEQQVVAMSTLDQEIAKFMAENNKIGAVKLARDTLGCGLKEAKDYVESKDSTGPFGKRPNLVTEDIAKTQRQIIARSWMEKVAKDYGGDLP